jgi:hypothetical protein
MQFCSAECVTAYKRRLDEKTIAKIRWLDFLSTPSTVAAQGNGIHFFAASSSKTRISA